MTSKKREDKELKDFRQWLREQPLIVVPDHPLMNEQIDNASGDYIEDYCREKNFLSEKQTKHLVG